MKKSTFSYLSLFFVFLFSCSHLLGDNNLLLVFRLPMFGFEQDKELAKKIGGELNPIIKNKNLYSHNLQSLDRQKGNVRLNQTRVAFSGTPHITIGSMGEVQKDRGKGRFIYNREGEEVYLRDIHKTIENTVKKWIIESSKKVPPRKPQPVLKLQKGLELRYHDKENRPKYDKDRVYMAFRAIFPRGGESTRLRALANFIRNALEKRHGIEFKNNFDAHMSVAVIRADKRGQTSVDPDRVRIISELKKIYEGGSSTGLKGQFYEALKGIEPPPLGIFRIEDIYLIIGNEWDSPRGKFKLPK